MSRVRISILTGLTLALSLAAPALELDAPFGRFAIAEPAIPDREFVITEFGARPDGSDSSAAFAAAFAAASAAGGGRVLVPGGVWTVGAIHLKSNCELHLDEGAVLDFLDDPAKYPVVDTTWEGLECRNYSPLVYAYGCTNLAIVGKGQLRPRMAFWRTWFGRPESHIAATGELYHWGATNATLAARDLTRLPAAHMRPHLLQLNRCARIRLEGFRIRESPFWTVHLYHSQDVVVRALDIYAHGHNNDGIDVDMTQNVLIENCRFDQGDDGVCLKAGRNADAWRLNRPTANVVVRNCDYVHAGSLLGIGSELSGGVRNVWLHDCRISSPNNCVRIKTNRRRGGFVENVWVENCEIGVIREALFNIKTKYYYQYAVFPDYEFRWTPIRNIHLRNLKAQCADWMFDIAADEKCPAEDLFFERLSIGAVRLGMSKIENARGVTMNQVTLGKDRPVPPVELKDWIPTGAPDQADAVPDSEHKL